MVVKNLAAVLGVHSGKQLLVVGAPNGVPDSNGESRMDPIIADVIQQVQGTNVKHIPAGFIRTAKLKVPAKHREQVVNEEAAVAASEEEAKTVAVSEHLTNALALSPNAVLVIIDDIAKTCITLAALEIVVAKMSRTVTILLVALYTSPHLAGIAVRTLSDQDSASAMNALIKEQMRGPSCVDIGGCAVYLRTIEYTHKEGLEAANTIMADPTASTYERAWAKCWLENNGGDCNDGGSRLQLRYTGQVHTPMKTCEQRWDQEDGGNDRTGLVNQIRLRLELVRGQSIVWTSIVVLDQSMIACIAHAGRVDIMQATDFAEKAVFLIKETSYKNGGANCITPGPQDWGTWHVTQLRECVKAMIHSMPKSGNSEWLKTAEGKAAMDEVWSTSATVICAGNAHLCDFINLHYTDCNLTARELETAMCTFAGPYSHTRTHIAHGQPSNLRNEKPNKTRLHSLLHPNTIGSICHVGGSSRKFAAIAHSIHSITEPIDNHTYTRAQAMSACSAARMEVCPTRTVQCTANTVLKYSSLWSSLTGQWYGGVIAKRCVGITTELMTYTCLCYGCSMYHYRDSFVLTYSRCWWYWCPSVVLEVRVRRSIFIQISRQRHEIVPSPIT
jgi:hypothetical protein